ncbi:MAG: CPBP family intramembrane metalloprotease [Xanthomonadaceae bacterium]|nr:CPBP family intramembrane metalloprotease [Xanthomonadaceae bacterium]
MLVVRIGAATLLLVLTTAGLRQLAQTQFTAHLRNEAARELALAASGKTPWHWDFHRQDIVAGRVFGDADADFAGDCLLVKSRGSPFEFGLRLTRILPLRDFPRLHAFAFADKPAQAQIVVRKRLDGGEWTSASFPLAGISTPTTLDIDKIRWRDPDGQSASPPDVAAMLRLRFRLPRGATLQFNGAALERPVRAKRLDLTRVAALVDAGTPVSSDTMPVYRVPDVGVDAAQVALFTHSDPPILALPQTRRVERQRLLLDSIHSTFPAAIVVPQKAFDATFAQARAESMRAGATHVPGILRWLVLALYGGVLLCSRVSPPRNVRLRATLEATLALAGPLWLVVGGHFTGKVDVWQEFLIACVAIYAASLGYPRDWRWNGSQRAWTLAAAVVALAAGIAVAAHIGHGGPIRVIDPAHVLRYFGWALIQQYLICVVCASRWQLATTSNAFAAYLGALGFALLHTPNAGLMLATFAGGLCWCALYLRERALLPLAFSHAASAMILIALAPPSWLYSADVSARFFQ